MELLTDSSYFYPKMSCCWVSCGPPFYCTGYLPFPPISVSGCLVTGCPVGHHFIAQVNHQFHPFLSQVACCWVSCGPPFYCTVYSPFLPISVLGFLVAGNPVGHHFIAQVTHHFCPFLSQVALLLGVLWATSLVVFMFGHVLGIGSYSPNLVLVSFLFLFTINPFRICYYRARFWLLKILVSPLHCTLTS